MFVLVFSFFYQCWGGVMGILQAVAPGTRCYATSNGALDPLASASALTYASAVLVHENDVHCLPNTPCDPDGAAPAVLHCYFPPPSSGSLPFNTSSLCGKTIEIHNLFCLCSYSDPYCALVTLILTPCFLGFSFELLSVLCWRPISNH